MPLVSWTSLPLPVPQACRAFLKDLVKEGLRYGPLLGYAFVEGCQFVIRPEFNYVEPQIAYYGPIGTAGNAAIEHWARKFGLKIVKPRAQSLQAPPSTSEHVKAPPPCQTS